MVVATVVAMASALSGCGTSLLATTTSTASTVATAAASQTSTTTTAPLNGEVAVAFPVVECTSNTGAPLEGQGWKPSILLAPIPTGLVGKVEFYSDGVHTVLGPVGWSCAQTRSSDGARGLAVYPANNPNPPVEGTPAPGTEGIFATFDDTGNTVGIALVCPFFTVPAWQQQEANCAPNKPSGEQSSMPTPDVASVTDPAGVVGSLEASGGQSAVTGTVIFPQEEPAVTDGSSVDVAEESCSLPTSTWCPTVLSDFDVREFPVPGSGSSYSSDDGDTGDSH